MEEEQQEDQINLEKFLQWATHLGISDSPSPSPPNPTPLSCLGKSLSVSYFCNAGGRGLGAVRDINKGELILRVPKSALITSDALLLKDCKLSSVVTNRQSTLCSTQVLAVCLLYEMGKGKNSQWYPYLLQLPRSYDTLATFGQFEIQALQVDDVIWSGEKARSKSESEWKEAISLMKELNVKPKFLTYGAWLWASATISSRTMHVPWDDAGCLCPVGDFFNYAPPGEELLDDDLKSSINNFSIETNAVQLHDDELLKHLDTQSQRLIDGGYEEDVDAYCFYAKKNYKKGEQVLLSYGTYTNIELLEHYGFLLNENPNEKIFIPIDPDIYSCSSWPKDSLYIQHNGKPSFALLSALRIWATPRNQRRSLGHVAYSGSQISNDNEVLVMRWISNKCQNILKKLPTSIEQDRLVLLAVDKEAPASSCPEFCAFLEANNVRSEECVAEFSLKVKRAMEKWILAVQWRLRYKVTLTESISYCSDMVNTIMRTNRRQHLS